MKNSNSTNKYDIAAYVWPSYTGDEPRSLIFWPEGMGEWQTVRDAAARYEGHQWPRKPLWGYCNEADPYVMEMQIDAAADHGVNVFIYDWYWYDNRPFLEQCLNNGYLKARNNDRVKFYLMWANHDVLPAWDKRIAHIVCPNRGGVMTESSVWNASLNRSQFEFIARRMISNYFKHPSYYTINGCPVLSIYDLNNLILGFGGIDQTTEALAWFKKEAVTAGLPGLHLQYISLGNINLNLSGFDGGSAKVSGKIIAQLGFDSVTNYQFVHFVDIDRNYADILVDAGKWWEQFATEYSLPYFPHVSVGWDNNPRFEIFRKGVVKNNTPAEVEKGFRMAKAYVDTHPNQSPLITVNSWNEWTETSYLQPDDLYGYGYLEAIKNVFLS